ncbi:MAG: CPBP family intramembrane metalloprotease [Chloroflexota bacterium]|nr:CPBP family intramembrane metalloprotease [Chloroflexota bacterium]
MTSDQRERRELSLMQKLSSPEESAPPWRLLTAALTLAAMLVCLTVIGPALASLLLGSQQATSDLLMLSWALGMGATALFVLINRRGSADSWQSLRLDLRMDRRGPPLPLIALLGVAIALFINLLISLPSGQFLPLPEVYGIGAGGPGVLIVAALLLVFLQPLAETLVFQALLLPSLRWTLGPWRGLLAACLVFLLLHLIVFFAPWQAIYSAPWYGLAYPFSVCLAFSLLRVHSGSSLSVLVARISAGLIFLLTSMALTGF